MAYKRLCHLASALRKILLLENWQNILIPYKTIYLGKVQYLNFLNNAARPLSKNFMLRFELKNYV